MGPQQLVTGIEKVQPAARLDSTSAKFLAPLPANDPVISSVDQADRYPVFPNEVREGARLGSEFSRHRPAGIQLMPDFLIVDIVDREFVDAWIDQAQRMTETQQKKKPARPPHGPTEKQVANAGARSHPIPDVYFQPVRSEKDEFVDRSGMVFRKLQNNPSTHAVTDKTPPMSGGTEPGDNVFHDLIKLRGCERQSFSPFGLPMKGQINGDQRVARVEGFADEREAGGRFPVTMKGKQNPGPVPQI